MSKATSARVLVVVALLLSSWVLVTGFVAPFGSVGLSEATILLTGGIASLAAVIVAAVKPRQILSLTIASFLTVGHVVLWLLVAHVALHERGVF